MPILMNRLNFYLFFTQEDDRGVVQKKMIQILDFSLESKCLKT